MHVPAELKYAESHEWVRIDGDGAVVGITDHAQRELTDIVFVELPEVGTELKAGDSCAVVESVKTASDIYSPVSGTVTEINPKLAECPETVNDDAFGDGWFFRIKLTTPSELDGLLSDQDYRKQIEG